MRRPSVGPGAWWLAAVTAVLIGAPPGAWAQGDADAGKAVYDKWCAGCHGDNGGGDGVAAAYMLPRPRDFTRAVYQIRTTASGELPTDDDLRHVIDNGMPGSTMPGWKSRLSATQRDNVIAYLKTFSRFFEEGAPEPEPVSVGRPPKVTEESLAEGRRLFIDELQCNSCHGDAGRGNGTSAPTLTDDWGFPIRPADLSRNWTFNGGGEVEDIFMRMRTGLDGTPMPSNWDIVESEIITEEQLWQVAQYVRSLSPEEVPRPQDVIRASRLEGALPDGPDADAWTDVRRYYVPMVGQITVAPRQFVPTVDGVWVQAVHNETALAMRITWDDPTASPDPEWDEYFQGLAQVLTDVDGPLEAQGPDRLAVQFPVQATDGMERPYFLGGDSRRPVYRIMWTSTPDGIVEGRGTGLTAFRSNAGAGATHAAVFDDGQWRLQLTRPLVSPDTTLAPSLPSGEAIPMAFFASDGTQGGGDVRGSVSAWYAIYLDVPTPRRVFVVPVVAALLTVVLGMVVVWQAQAAHRQSGS